MHSPHVWQAKLIFNVSQHLQIHYIMVYLLLVPAFHLCTSNDYRTGFRCQLRLHTWCLRYTRIHDKANDYDSPSTNHTRLMDMEMRYCWALSCNLHEQMSIKKLGFKWKIVAMPKSNDTFIILQILHTDLQIR